MLSSISSLTKRFTIITKLNANRGNVALKARCALLAWLPSQSNTEQLERIQNIATKWITDSTRGYTGTLEKTNLLRCYKNLTLQGMLLVIAFIGNNFDGKIDKALQVHMLYPDRQTGENLDWHKSECKRPMANSSGRCKKCYNCLNCTCSMFIQRLGKTNLTKFYQKVFEKLNNDFNKCKWQLPCRYGSWNI